MNIYGSLMVIFDETKREAHTLLLFNSMLYLILNILLII